MLPTEQQQAIYDYVGSKRRHIAVNALAGSGKTTTAVQAAKHAGAGKRVGFTAFNRHIAEELQSRLGGDATASTIHALGKRTLTNAGISHDIDARKYSKLHRELFPSCYDHRDRLLKEYQGIVKLIDIFRSGLVDINATPDARRKHLTKLALLQGFDMPRQDSVWGELVAQAANLVQVGIERMQTIDFGDMISAPNYLALASSPSFDFLIADEAQDFNRAQQELVRKLGSRIMFVGDPNQAIMLFAGADAASFSTLRRELNANELPLSICWRCPSSHLALARYLVPSIQDRPGAVEGEVEETVFSALPRIVRPGEMVICRNNAPLLSLAYSLVADKIPVMIRGRNIGQGLNDIIEKLRPNDIRDLEQKLKLYRQSNHERLVEREATEATIQAHLDACDCIQILCDSHKNIWEMKESINQMFAESDDTEKVILSSIHRAKGSECDTVYILAPHLLGRRGKNAEATIQEVNLAYVALTRAKRRLVLVDTFGSNRPNTREWLASMSYMGQETEVLK